MILVIILSGIQFLINLLISTAVYLNCRVIQDMQELHAIF